MNHPFYVQKEDTYYAVMPTRYVAVKESDVDPQIRVERNDEYGRIDLQLKSIEWYRPITEEDFEGAYLRVRERTWRLKEEILHYKDEEASF